MNMLGLLYPLGNIKNHRMTNLSRVSPQAPVFVINQGNQEGRRACSLAGIIRGELHSNRPSPRSGRWNCSPGWSEAEPGV